MRRLLWLILLLPTLHLGIAQAATRPLLQLVVTAPYLEMHSGPGRGYPVIYVIGRDEIVTVLFSRTDWYKVRAAHGEEGWAASRRRFRPIRIFPATTGRSARDTGCTTGKIW